MLTPARVAQARDSVAAASTLRHSSLAPRSYGCGFLWPLCGDYRRCGTCVTTRPSVLTSKALVWLATRDMVAVLRGEGHLFNCRMLAYRTGLEASHCDRHPGGGALLHLPHLHWHRYREIGTLGHTAHTGMRIRAYYRSSAGRCARGWCSQVV